MSWEGVTNGFITYLSHSGSLQRYLFPSNSEFCHPLPKISNKRPGVLIAEIRQFVVADVALMGVARMQGHLGSLPQNPGSAPELS